MLNERDECLDRMPRTLILILSTFRREFSWIGCLWTLMLILAPGSFWV